MKKGETTRNLLYLDPENYNERGELDFTVRVDAENFSTQQTFIIYDQKTPDLKLYHKVWIVSDYKGRSGKVLLENNFRFPVDSHGNPIKRKNLRTDFLRGNNK